MIYMSTQVMDRRTFLELTGSGLAGLAASSPNLQRLLPEQDQPNVIYILADDLGWSELGAYGNDFNETPNLDRLARQGMRFTDAYAAAPVCTPMRASLMTGQYPARVGLTDYLRADDKKHLSPSAHRSVAEGLSGLGYHTGLIGKWHLMGDYSRRRGDPSRHGFDEVIASETRYIGGGDYFYPYKHLPELEEPKVGTAPGEGSQAERSHARGSQREEAQRGEFLTDRLCHEATRFIERSQEGEENQPFFLYLSHYAVHTRLAAKDKLLEKYKKKYDARHGEGAADKFDAPDNPRHIGQPDNPYLAAMLESIDRGVGAIMDTLNRLGLTDNTVLIFNSDNGGQRSTPNRSVTTNAPLRGGKSELYEGGIRVPLIVRWPGVVEPGTESHEPVSSIDFYPTFLEMAGGAPPQGATIDGRSLVPILEQSGDLGREALLWHYPLDREHFLGGRSSGALRKGDHKLIEFYDTGELELYNLAEDLGETNDLSDEQPEKVYRLKQQFRNRLEEIMANQVVPPWD